MQDVLKTDRLILRSLTLADAKRYSELASNWHIARMTGSLPYPIPEISAEIKIEMSLSRKRRGLMFPYVITLDGSDLIGVMDIFKTTEDQAFELGYWLGQDYWGQGYASEAAIAVLNEVSSSIGVKKYMASVFIDNPASMRVLEKIGFHSTGLKRRSFSMSRLKHEDTIVFSIELK